MVNWTGALDYGSMPSINETGTVWVIINGLTENVTGSLFLTMLLFYIIIIGFTLAFNMDFEISALLLLPLTLVVMVVSGEFIGLGMLMLMFIGGIFAKYFWFTK